MKVRQFLLNVVMGYIISGVFGHAELKSELNFEFWCTAGHWRSLEAMALNGGHTIFPQYSHVIYHFWGFWACWTQILLSFCILMHWRSLAAMASNGGHTIFINIIMWYIGNGVFGHAELKSWLHFAFDALEVIRGHGLKWRSQYFYSI